MNITRSGYGDAFKIEIDDWPWNAWTYPRSPRTRHVLHLTFSENLEDGNHVMGSISIPIDQWRRIQSLVNTLIEERAA